AVSPVSQPVAGQEAKGGSSPATLLILLVVAALVAAAGFGIVRTVLGAKNQRRLAYELESLSERASTQLPAAPAVHNESHSAPVFALEVIAGPQEGISYDVG